VRSNTFPGGVCHCQDSSTPVCLLVHIIKAPTPRDRSRNVSAYNWAFAKLYPDPISESSIEVVE